MSNDELKNILTRCAVTAQDGCTLTVGEAETVLDLAEIGRLAVEARRVDREPTWDSDETWAERSNTAEDARNASADAFLAKHGGGG